MENEENKPISKNVETYTDDMVKALGESKGGLIKKIIHEEEKHNSEKKNLSPKSKKNKLFLAISIILVLAALLIVLFLLFFNRKVSVPIKPQFSSSLITLLIGVNPFQLTTSQMAFTACLRIIGSVAR